MSMKSMVFALALAVVLAVPLSASAQGSRGRGSENRSSQDRSSQGRGSHDRGAQDRGSSRDSHGSRNDRVRSDNGRESGRQQPDRSRSTDRSWNGDRQRGNDNVDRRSNNNDRVRNGNDNQRGRTDGSRNEVDRRRDDNRNRTSYRDLIDNDRVRDRDNDRRRENSRDWDRDYDRYHNSRPYFQDSRYRGRTFIQVIGDRHEWRDVALVAGFFGLIGALEHDDFLCFAGGAGAFYAMWRYEEDLQCDDPYRHARACYFNMPYFYRDGYRYERRLVFHNGERCYQFVRI
jgi:hypothetical protein